MDVIWGKLTGSGVRGALSPGAFCPQLRFLRGPALRPRWHAPHATFFPDVTEPFDFLCELRLLRGRPGFTRVLHFFGNGVGREAEFGVLKILEKMVLDILSQL